METVNLSSLDCDERAALVCQHIRTCGVLVESFLEAVNKHRASLPIAFYEEVMFAVNMADLTLVNINDDTGEFNNE